MDKYLVGHIHVNGGVLEILGPCACGDSEIQPESDDRMDTLLSLL